MQEFNQISPVISVHQLECETETRNIAQIMSCHLQIGDILALWGDLGVGKSTLARGIIQSLCGADIDVPSPTFTLVQTYDAPDYELWHMDLYRLDAPEDIFELGVEDAFYDGVSLIEWPDKMGRYLPLDRLDIVMKFNAGTDMRELSFQGSEAWADRLKEFKI